MLPGVIRWRSLRWVLCTGGMLCTLLLLSIPCLCSWLFRAAGFLGLFFATYIQNLPHTVSLYFVALLLLLSHFSGVPVCATLWVVAHQVPLSVRFSRQDCWSGLPCPPPGDLPDAGTVPTCLMSPALAGTFLTTSTTWETPKMPYILFIVYHVSSLTPQHWIIEIKFHEGKNFLLLFCTVFPESRAVCLAHGRPSINTY